MISLFPRARGIRRELEVGDSSTEIDNESNTLDVTVDQAKRNIWQTRTREKRDGNGTKLIHEGRVKIQHVGF